MASTIRLGLCVAVTIWTGTALAQGEPPSVQEEGAPERSSLETKRKADDGLYVLLGGGAEGYAGETAPRLKPGPSFGAIVGFKPTNIFGVELGYSGGLHDVDSGPAGIQEGVDVIRNGVHLAATVGFMDSRLQPYSVGGIGLESHDLRGSGGDFQDGNKVFVPVGVGLRYHFGGLINADARVTYNLYVDDTPTVTDSLVDGRYQGLLMLGGTY